MDEARVRRASCLSGKVVFVVRLTESLVLATVIAVSAASLAAQAPQPVDTSKLGPQVGTVVPPVSGVDQFGKTHTLESVAGPQGTMLVFFRSADW